MPHSQPLHWRGRFFKRVFTRLALLLSLGILLVCILTWQLMQQWLRDYVNDNLRKHAQVARLVISRDWPYTATDPLQRVCSEVREHTGIRLTVIAPDGGVLGDSDAIPAEMENHATRPEVVEALAGRVGRHRRTSASVGRPFVYVAIPMSRDNQIAAIVRVAAPAKDIADREAAVAQWIGVGLAVALPLSLILAWFLARDLANPIHRLGAGARRLATGDLTTQVEVFGNDEIAQIAESLERMRSSLASRIRDAQRKRQDLEVVLRNVEEGVIAVDADGTVLMVNAAARKLLGITTSPVGGALRAQLGRRSLGPLWDDAVAADAAELQREIVMPGPDGERTVDAMAVRVNDPDTPIRWLLCLSRH
ncbi:MAG: HAMP domain-containing protein, partial [Planctomycetota bacterium]|nr:HAMP domain-containing protein [Planctomycetota bacterium]